MGFWRQLFGFEEEPDYRKFYLEGDDIGMNPFDAEAFAKEFYRKGDIPPTDIPEEGWDYFLE